MSNDLISRKFVNEVVCAEFVDLQDGTEEWRSYVNNTCESILEEIDNAPTVNTDEIYKKGYHNGFFATHDVSPTVEPCYQTTSCLDCKNYDKENHNCPRYCEVIKEAIKSRPQGEWKLIKANEYENDVNGDYYINTYACPSCNWEVRTEGEMEYRFCPMCGADMRGEKK